MSTQTPPVSPKGNTNSQDGANNETPASFSLGRYFEQLINGANEEVRDLRSTFNNEGIPTAEKVARIGGALILAVCATYTLYLGFSFLAKNAFRHAVVLLTGFAAANIIQSAKSEDSSVVSFIQNVLDKVNDLSLRIGLTKSQEQPTE